MAQAGISNQAHNRRLNQRSSRLKLYPAAARTALVRSPSRPLRQLRRIRWSSLRWPITGSTAARRRISRRLAHGCPPTANPAVKGITNRLKFGIPRRKKTDTRHRLSCKIKTLSGPNPNDQSTTSEYLTNDSIIRRWMPQPRWFRTLGGISLTSRPLNRQQLRPAWRIERHTLTHDVKHILQCKKKQIRVRVEGFG